MYDKYVSLVSAKIDGEYYGDSSLVSVNNKSKKTILPNYYLDQNYPNPFNSMTNFSFTTTKTGTVKIKIYDIMGKEIQTILDKEVVAGKHTIQWDANYLPSGIYFYKIQSDLFIQTKKMLLIK